MSILEIKNGGIFFTTRDENVFAEPYGDGCARVRASRNTRISDEKWTLLDPEPSDAEVYVDGDVGIIKNGKLTVRVVRSWSGCRIADYSRWDVGTLNWQKPR